MAFSKKAGKIDGKQEKSTGIFDIFKNSICEAKPPGAKERTKMTKEQLRNYVDLKKELEHIKVLKEEIETKLYGTKAQQLTGMPNAHGGAGQSDRIEELIDKRAKLLERYRSLEIRLEEELMEIEAAIETVPDPKARTLLRLKYVDGLEWVEVCSRIGYEWAQTHRIHADALRMIAQKKEA